jgi:hypothetical protein
MRKQQKLINHVNTIMSARFNQTKQQILFPADCFSFCLPLLNGLHCSKVMKYGALPFSGMWNEVHNESVKVNDDCFRWALTLCVYTLQGNKREEKFLRCRTWPKASPNMHVWIFNDFWSKINMIIHNSVYSSVSFVSFSPQKTVTRENRFV